MSPAPSLRAIASIVVLAFTVTSIGTVPVSRGDCPHKSTLSPPSRFKAVADAKQTLPAKRYVGARRIEMGRARRLGQSSLISHKKGRSSFGIGGRQALGVFIGLGAFAAALVGHPHLAAGLPAFSVAGAALAMTMYIGRLKLKIDGGRPDAAATEIVMEEIMLKWGNRIRSDLKKEFLWQRVVQAVTEAQRSVRAMAERREEENAERIFLYGEYSREPSITDMDGRVFFDGLAERDRAWERIRAEKIQEQLQAIREGEIAQEAMKQIERDWGEIEQGLSKRSPAGQKSRRARGAGLTKIIATVAALAIAYSAVAWAADGSFTAVNIMNAVWIGFAIFIAYNIASYFKECSKVKNAWKEARLDSILHGDTSSLKQAFAKLIDGSRGSKIHERLDQSLDIIIQSECLSLYIKALIEIVRDDPDADKRAFAAHALGMIADYIASLKRNRDARRLAQFLETSHGEVKPLVGSIYVTYILEITPAKEALHVALDKEIEAGFHHLIAEALRKVKLATSLPSAETSSSRQSGRTLLGLTIGASILIVGLGILFWYHPQPQQPSQAPTTQPVQQPIPKEAPASGNPLEGIIRLNRILMDPAATPLERYHALQELEEDPSAGALVPILIEVASEPNSPVIDYPELEDGRIVERRTSLCLLAIKTLERIMAPSEVKIRALQKIAQRNPNDILILTKVREAIERLRHTGPKPKGAKQAMRLPQLPPSIPLTKPQVAAFRRSP